MSIRRSPHAAAAPMDAHRRVRTTALGLALALLLVLLPVEPVVVHAQPPDVVSETVDELPEQAGPAAAPDAGGRSEVVEAPLPFTGLGITGEGPEPEVRVRTLGLDGEWSPWTDVEVLDDADGPDRGSPEHGRAEATRGPDGWTSDAVWAGEASHAQFEVDRGRVGDLAVTFIDAMGLSETRVERIARGLRSLGTAGRPAAEAASRPGIVTRAQWGADESLRRGSPSYATVRFGVLHHTATTNSYTRTQAAGQIRNIYHWHTQGNGWNDIGYNFLVDRFGRIYEGRYGGVDRGVVGAHARDWNTGSFGVAMLGTHGAQAPSSAAMGAATDLIAWKYRVHGINPDPAARVTVNGRSIPTLVGHRDVGDTSCPGYALYERMGGMRRSVAKKSAASSSATATPSGWVPVTGDWNGDGRETAGWYRDGRWRLSDRTNNKATVDHRFAYGRAGDVPVVGDWNKDGTDTIGVFREGRWYLRNRNDKGPADASFGYGRAGDVPVVGDFNGNGRPDGIGVRRGKQWILRDRPDGSGHDLAFSYGRATDVAVVADWNGPHAPSAATGLRDGIGAVRSTDWHVRRDASPGAAHASFRFSPAS